MPKDDPSNETVAPMSNEDLKSVIDRLSALEGTMALHDSDTAKAIAQSELRIVEIEKTVGGLTTQFSDLTAKVSAMASSKNSQAADAPVAPGGGDPADMASGTTMNWGG
jgi:hypothetical protein